MQTVYNPTPETRNPGQTYSPESDINGNLKTTLGAVLPGQDAEADVQKVEQRFNGTLVTADDLVKTGAGFVHTITFSCNDAAPAAGSIIVYNSLTESGTQLFNHTFTTTPFVPFTVTLDMEFSLGLYIGFTTTNDVNVSVSWR